MRRWLPNCLCRPNLKVGPPTFSAAPSCLAMPYRTVAPYSFPRNRAAFAPIRPAVAPERCEQRPCGDVPLKLQAIEAARVIALRERHHRYAGEGERQERGGHGFELHCVMIGAGVKMNSPFVETPTVIVKSEQEAEYLLCESFPSPKVTP